MTASRRLLVVDDHKEFADLVVDVAARLGFDARSTNSAREFKEFYSAETPDVVVLDIVMPESDGIELIQWLINSGYHGRIVVATGYGPMYANAAKVLGEGRGPIAITTLRKPATLAEIRACLNEDDRPDAS